MKHFVSSLLALLCAAIPVFAQIATQNLRCESLTNPIGLDIQQPRFSWQLVSEKRNVRQTAYEIQVSMDAVWKNLVWSSGRIASDQSVHVAYAGKPLASGQKYWWQVRVWDNYGNASDFSAPAFWQTGLFDASDWKAQWVQIGYEEDSLLRPCPLFRKQFSLKKKIRSATAYVTAQGLYEAHINGERVGDAYLTPGWTTYNKRIQYQAFDVTSLLWKGDNAVGVALGSGWFRGYLGWEDNKNVYGKELALLFQLDITYTDGSTETIGSDGSWKSSTGSIRESEIYHGETIDARLEKPRWTTADYDDRDWSGVKLKQNPAAKLVGTSNELIKKHETFRPIKIFKTPKGEQVIDFGQNLVGWVQVKASGKSGDKITISHAEVLDKSGNFYTENMRSARTQSIYILSGKGEETFEPHFTFFGFRYIKIEGYPGEVKPENFTAIALYSDMKPTGHFECSNPLLNQLQHNIQWGQKGNFLDVPTDCPQRDERMGWTGDAQVFSRTAAFNMDVQNFFAKWLKDVALDQRPDGAVPFVVPNVLGDSSAASTGWADAATIIPWNVYLAYGDKRVLEEQYESMKAWVGYMENNSRNYLWNTGFHFGDWLFYDADDDRMGISAITDKYLIAQCFAAHSTQILLDAARVLGKKEDETRYAALLAKFKEAFVKEYMTPNGRLVSGTQTAYTLALHFDMLPENLRAQAAEKLANNVKSYKYHLTTGFLGTPYLCHVLTRFGYTDVAYKLLLQETYPSWLYPVKMGATTIWERWDGIKPDSTFQTPTMNSFNHYAYGAIGDWMYRTIAGLDTDEKVPGYKEIFVKPHLGGDLTHASATLQTNYGQLRSAWKIENKTFSLEVDIPANTNATIHVPTKNAASVLENGATLSASKDFKIEGVENGYVVLKAGAGKYRFQALVD